MQTGSTYRRCGEGAYRPSWSVGDQGEAGWEDGSSRELASSATGQSPIPPQRHNSGIEDRSNHVSSDCSLAVMYNELVFSLAERPRGTARAARAAVARGRPKSRSREGHAIHLVTPTVSTGTLSSFCFDLVLVLISAAVLFRAYLRGQYAVDQQSQRGRGGDGFAFGRTILIAISSSPPISLSPVLAPPGPTPRRSLDTPSRD